MNKEIMQLLAEIEEKENIEILYACEAGSRALGFANEDSDWDIRFIYRNVNVGDYLSLTKTRDIIEYEGDDMDIVGWDIKKALMLHYKSNPSLREWLISSQVYIDKGINVVFDGLGDFDRDILKNYYLGMAQSHWKRYCRLNEQTENVKKYLYVIRCILSWNLLDNGIYPPLQIQELLDEKYSGISAENRDAVLNLIDYLQSSAKLSENTLFKLNNFILNSFNSMERIKTAPDKDFDTYDSRFKELLLIIS